MSNLIHTADEILRCARTLIIAGGYNGFSYADIAKVVGIRNASIHHHFPTKTDLVRTLVARYREEAAAGIAELEQLFPDPATRLRAYVGFWQGCIADATAPICVCALLASQIPVLPEEVVREVKAHFRTLSAWLASVLAQGESQGLFRLTGTADAEAETFLATIHGAMLSARAHGDAGMFTIITRSALEHVKA